MPPKPLVCKKCGKRYAFPLALRGQTVACKGCGHIIPVPDEEEESGEYDIAPTPGAAPPVVTPPMQTSNVPPKSPARPGAKSRANPAQPPASAWAAAAQSRNAAPAETRTPANTPEAAVDSNQGVDALKKFFSDAKAVDFYARRRAGIFSRGRVTPACVCCNRPDAEVRAFTWTADKTGEGEPPTFTTYHTICRSCWQSFQLRKTIAMISLVLVLIVALAVVIPLVFALQGNFLFSRTTALVAALPLAIPLIIAAMLINRFKIPPALRFMTGGKFKLKDAVTLG